MTLPPLRREIVVRLDAAAAFARFTDEIGVWWPLATHSVGGAGGEVGFVDGRLVETLADGSRTVWAEVLDWEPPARFRMTWHPGRSGPAANGELPTGTEVEVRFEETDGGTRVVLVHSGWEALADPAAGRGEYESGWVGVLAEYATLPASWFALLHTPAAGIAPGEVMASPLVGEHFAFLQRCRDRGWLVAAGPFGDAPGAGMTVLKVPGGTDLADVEKLARFDDKSVAGGLLEVAVRPWRVVLAA